MTEQERDQLARETAQRIRELAFSRTGYDHHKAEHIIAEALARGAAPAPVAVVSKGAVAGIAQALGQPSGAQVVMVGAHEIDDLAASGQAFTLDGRFNLRLDYERGGGKLRRLDPGWAAPAGAPKPQEGR